MTESQKIASRAIGAGLWTVGMRIIVKSVDLVMLLSLARFLDVADFGLVATAMAVVLIVEALFELPMTLGLLRAPVLVPGMLHTAFTVSLLRGSVVAAVLLALAWPLAVFNDEPRMTTLLAVLALAPAMRGLVNPRMVEFVRAFDFRPDALLELVGKLVALVLSVVIAARTGSYWAIAAATVAAPLTTTLLSYGVAPWRPRLSLTHWSYFSNLVGWNFLSQVCTAFNWQVDRLILPRLTTTTSFGHYAMGKQISEIPSQALLQPLLRPASAALISSPADQRQARYLKLSHAIVLLMLPVMGLPLLWPDVLVHLALGARWAPAAPWLRWVSVLTVLSLPVVLMPALAMTLDRTRLAMFRTLLELLIRLPVVWWGAVNFGLAGAVAGSATASSAGTLMSMLVVRRLLGVGLGRQVRAFWRPLLAILPAVALLHATRPLVMERDDLAAMVLLALSFGLAYLLLYGLSVFLLWHCAGRPAGLEHHVLAFLRRHLLRLGSVVSRTFASSSTPSNEVGKHHVEHKR